LFDRQNSQNTNTRLVERIGVSLDARHVARQSAKWCHLAANCLAALSGAGKPTPDGKGMPFPGKGKSSSRLLSDERRSQFNSHIFPTYSTYAIVKIKECQATSGAFLTAKSPATAGEALPRTRLSA
jgi:hypothetical protein